MWGQNLGQREKKRFLCLSFIDVLFLHISPYIHLLLVSLKSSRSAAEKEIISPPLLAFFDRLCFPSSLCSYRDSCPLKSVYVCHTRKYPRRLSYQRRIKNSKPRLMWTGELFLSRGLLLPWGHHDPALWSLYIFLGAHFSVCLQDKCIEVVLLNQNKYTFRFWLIQLNRRSPSLLLV